MRLLVACIFACLALACVFVTAKEYEHMKDLSFATVKSQPMQRLVVFYFGSDDTAAPVLDMVESTAEYINSLDLAKLKHFQFAKVDCETEENKPECDEAGFKTAGIWIFTSTPHEGIQAYSGARDTATLATHIRHKFLPYDETDVLSFVDEHALFERMDKSERDPPKPIMVKFWESWCTHCKQLKLPYDQAASFFKDQVEFMEVECSKNDDTKSFCQNNGIQSYPTLILFDGEKKHNWDQADKSITSFQNFFLSTLPEDRYTRVEDKEAANLPPPPGAKPVEEKQRPASTGGASAAGSKKKKSSGADDAAGDDAPAKKKKTPARRAADDDEDEEPRRRRRPARRDDDEYDEAPRRRTQRRRPADDEDEYDEPPRRRRAPPRRRAQYDDEDEYDEPPRRASKKQQQRRRYDEEEEEDQAPKKKAPAKKQQQQQQQQQNERPVHDEL